MTTAVRTTCICCGARLKPGYDYPYEPVTDPLLIEIDGKHPIVCRDPVACLKRSGHEPQEGRKT